MCVGPSPTGPYLSDHDASDAGAGIVCTRADDLSSDARTLYYVGKALKWLLAL